MKLVLLPGHNPATKGWMQDLALLLKGHADSISIHHYDHWHTSRPLDETSELVKIRETVAHEPFIFIGASFGVTLALTAIKKGIKPQACVFIGSSLRTKEGGISELPALFQNYDVPTLFIQAMDDPYGSPVELAQLIKQKNISATIHTPQSNEHEYSDLEHLGTPISAFIVKQSDKPLKKKKI